MSRIRAALSGIDLRLVNRLNAAQAAVSESSLRLATGQIINAPSDDPSGYVALAGLNARAWLVARTQANVTRASALATQTQTALDQIKTQLNTLRGKALEDEDQALTADQRTANQAAIDAAIVEVDRLVSQQIEGRRILDGSANYDISGVNGSQIAEVHVYARPATSSSTIAGSVTVAATQAQLTYTGAAGLTTAAASITLTGDRGAVAVTVNNGESLTTLADRINLESHRTGVLASVAGDNLALISLDYGTAADVKVQVASGTFSVTGGTAGAVQGTNGTATINGRSVTGQGNRFEVQDNGLRFRLEFAGGFSGAFTSLTVSGQALQFQVTTEPGRVATVAMPGLQSARLGGPSGLLSDLVSGGTHGGLGTKAPQAVRIVDEALGELTRARGAWDGFATAAVTGSANLLAGLATQLSTTIDLLNKVDVARETALRTRNRILVANAEAGLVISQQERSGIVAILQRMAGI